MSTLQMIEERVKILPRDLQQEALHYVEFLLARSQAGAESTEWARFAGAELEKHYGPVDAIYDQE